MTTRHNLAAGWYLNAGVHKFSKKCTNHFKILDARKRKRSKFHIKNLKILVTTVQNLVATVAKATKFSRHCTKFSRHCIKFSRHGDLTPEILSMYLANSVTPPFFVK